MLAFTKELEKAMIEAAAEVLWNDFHARYGGAWSDQPEDGIAAIQTRATAKAAIFAALKLYVPAKSARSRNEYLIKMGD